MGGVRIPGRPVLARPHELGRSPWRRLVAIIVILAAATWWWSSRPTEADRIRLTSPVGERVTGPQCALVLIDQSSSMDGSDPSGLREVAVEELGRWYGRHGIPGDQVGVGWFADSSDITTPRSPEQIGERVDAGPDPAIGDGTMIARALRSDGQSLASCPRGSQPSLILVSDGITSETWAEVTSALDSLPAAATMHLFAMNADGGFSSSDAEQFWTNAGPKVVAVDQIKRLDADSITGPLARFVVSSTGQAVEQVDG